MELSDSFKDKLAFGKRIEVAVQKWLSELLPEYTVLNTNQEKYSKDRDTYFLVDVVVLGDDDKPLLGIECKRSDTAYKICYWKNGWLPEYNTPLNKSSFDHYKQATFPFYLININEFAKRILVADIDTVKNSRKDEGIDKKSGEVVINFDGSHWDNYHSTHLKVILGNIIKKEGLC